MKAIENLTMRWLAVCVIMIPTLYGVSSLAISLEGAYNNIANLEQTVAELQLDLEALEEQQQQGIRGLLACADTEAVCFERRQEMNAHCLPGRIELLTWCCPGPDDLE